MGILEKLLTKAGKLIAGLVGKAAKSGKDLLKRQTRRAADRAMKKSLRKHRGTLLGVAVVSSILAVLSCTGLILSRK